MKNKIIFPLSDYQRATLNEMGIPTWQQIEASAVISEPVARTNNAASKLSRGSSSEDFLQRARASEAQELSHAKSIPQKILLLMPEAQSKHPLITDVINTLNLPLNVTITAPTADADEYVDYLLAWKVAPEMALNGLVLSTPDLSQLASSEAKKQLWQILQNCHLFE